MEPHEYRVDRRNFLSLDARDGPVLYGFSAGRPRGRGEVTWKHKGYRYIAVASGHGGGSIPLTGSTTIVVFAH